VFLAVCGVFKVKCDMLDNHIAAVNPSVLVSGSCGLIGSEVAHFFARHGLRVIGIDSNHRAIFFGPEGDTITAGCWNACGGT
jgi:hypothetical protein